MARKAQAQSKSMQETIEFLNSLGYRGGYEYDDGVYIVRTKVLRIGVFPEDYPNLRLRGKIVAEHKECFDKWTKAYYLKDYPKGNRAKEEMQRELVEICSKEHFERSNKHETYEGNYC